MSEVSYGGGVWNPDAMDKGTISPKTKIRMPMQSIFNPQWPQIASEHNFESFMQKELRSSGKRRKRVLWMERGEPMSVS